MKMFTTILWDVDNTLLDFDRSEREALLQSFQSFGLKFSEEILARYSAINKSLWEKLERKEVTKEEVLHGRFVKLFESLSDKRDEAFTQAFKREYQHNLANVFFYLENSDALMRRLKELDYRQYFVTNGVASTQRRKLALSGLDKLADGLFISEEIGVEKPDSVFFERSFAQIPGFDKKTALLVGDSLSSDMEGARRCGVSACWYNAKRKQNPAAQEKGAWQPDYEISSLWNIFEILGEEAGIGENGESKM